MGTSSWLVPGQRVELNVEQCPPSLSVVDSAGTHEIRVAGPLGHDGGPLAAPTAGTRTLLIWPTDRGWHRLETDLVAELPGHVVLWSLRPLGRPSVEQRRAFARAPVALRVRLQRAEQTWHGVTLDIGEGGLRCVISDPGELAAGAHLLVTMAIDEREISCSAELLEVSVLNGRSVVRARFEDLGRSADILRRHVLEQQRRARALSR
jgi:hypothetical protein